MLFIGNLSPPLSTLTYPLFNKQHIYIYRHCRGHYHVYLTPSPLHSYPLAPALLDNPVIEYNLAIGEEGGVVLVATSADKVLIVVPHPYPPPIPPPPPQAVAPPPPTPSMTPDSVVTVSPQIVLVASKSNKTPEYPLSAVLEVATLVTDKELIAVMTPPLHLCLHLLIWM